MGGPVLLPVSTADGEALVRLAAETIHAHLFSEPIDGRPPPQPALRRLGSSFVTLERSGALRGCIGTLEPTRPLYRDVIRNALKAMRDPRMDPVEADEWPELLVSVAVLSPSEPLPAKGLAELTRRLRPHVDGLILTAGRRQATFLPAVWEKLPDPVDFVAALLAKGGWAPDRLPPGASVRRYTTAEFR